MKRRIEPIGNYLPQDENGFIINDLTFEKIDKKWHLMLKLLVDIYQQNLGEHLHSVYVRGSVARVFAVDGVSDLDTFALVKPSFSIEKIRWQKADFQLITEIKILSEYDFVTNIEMMLATYDADFVNSRLAMIVKTQSLFLFGNDISKTLKNYQVNGEMRTNSRWLLADMADFLLISEVNFTLKNCSDMMKIILRTGFELVMERVGQFSPDLYVCYRDFSIFYPEKAVEMQQVLTWFLNPILDKKVLNIFVEDFGKWFENHLVTVF